MEERRVLLTSDIHCTDLETWYGVSNEERMEHWLRTVLREHEKQPFDLIVIPGDISLDYHQGLSPFQKGYSTAYLFVKMYLSRLPAGVPVLVGAGNHEHFSQEVWHRITGCSRQDHFCLGKDTFILLESFRQDLGPCCERDEIYTPLDTGYIRQLLDRYPENRVWLVAHWFDMERETEAFRSLVAREPRIRGLFCGHSHDHRLIPLGPDYGGKCIAQTGNFSYTMSGADTGGFWGFRDLIIGRDKAVSRYIMADSQVRLEGQPVRFRRRESEVAEYEL